MKPNEIKPGQRWVLQRGVAEYQFDDLTVVERRGQKWLMAETDWPQWQWLFTAKELHTTYRLVEDANDEGTPDDPNAGQH